MNKNYSQEFAPITINVLYNCAYVVKRIKITVICYSPCRRSVMLKRVIGVGRGSGTDTFLAHLVSPSRLTIFQGSTCKL